MSTELVKVEGLRELEAALGQVPKAFRRPVVLRALRKAAQPIINEARARVRRQANPTHRGGVRIGSRMANKWGLSKSLAQSIGARAEKTDTSSPSGATVAVGPARGHFYGLFVEKGTRAHQTRVARDRAAYTRRSRRTGELRVGFRRALKLKRAHAATRAFPFLAPAWEAHRHRVVLLAGEELWAELRALVARLADRASAGSLSRRERRALS